jgi:alpha-tubulin suppressor-like RCC1 family protein
MRTSIKTQRLPLTGHLLSTTKLFAISFISLLGCLSARTEPIHTPGSPTPAALSTLPTVIVSGDESLTLPNSIVMLYGTGTAAAGHTIVSHVWTKTSGGAATITSPAADNTSVSGLAKGSYTFLFTVTDNAGQKASASVLITVYAPSAPPVVKVSSPQTITLPTSSVTLSGSATAATGRSIISQTWTKISGGAATIISPASNTTAVSGLVPGTYTFALNVLDNGGLRASGTVLITVLAASTPPTLKVSGAQTITLPASTVTLTGSATAETGHTIASWLWTKTSGLAGITITSASSATTTVTGLAKGTYTFLLTVTDNTKLTASATVTITVNAAPVTTSSSTAPSTPPTLKVGGAQTITLPTSTVTLTGSATAETGHTIASWLWTKTSGLAGITITSASSATTTVTGLAKGTYTFLLTVTDNTKLTASGSVTITVDAAAPVVTPPVTTPPVTTPPVVTPPVVTPPVTTPPTTTSKYSVANGEYANFILDNTTQTLYGARNNQIGTGSVSGNPASPTLCQFPTANTKIAFVAAGLHTATCIDTHGNVYFTGPNEDGSMGNGTTSGSTNSFVQVSTDDKGDAFTNVQYLTMGSSIFTGGAGYGAIVYAIKTDGTLWVWGNTSGGYAGNGTYGGVVTRPTQITSFPAGTVITKIVVQSIVIALDSKGNVWTWAGNGGDNCLLGNTSRANYETPQILSLPSAAKDIAGGGLWSYALLTNGSLYGWGLYLGYMGVGATASSGWTIQPSPILLDDDLDLPSPIAHISCNTTSTYAILTNGTLWAWGASECGQIGNGQDIDYAKYTTDPAPYGGVIPAPYAWNWDLSTAQLQQHKPMQIGPGLDNFVALSEGTADVFYKFAVDANGQLYSWGRNKTGILGNGVMEGDYVLGTLGAMYPNSFDVPWITAVNPFELTETIYSSSPLCISKPGSNYCNVFSIPLNTPPVASPGSNQTVAGPTAVLDGTASKDNEAIVYYIWSQVSGPNQATISIPSGAKANLLGLTKGVYVFQLKVIDNGWMSDSAKVTITVLNTNAAATNTDTLDFSSASLTNTDSTMAGKAFAIYPNPVTDQFTLVIGNKYMGVTNVQLIDAIGVIRHQYSFIKDLQTMQYNVSASDLPRGIYFLRAQLGTWTGTLKMVKN